MVLTDQISVEAYSENQASDFDIFAKTDFMNWTQLLSTTRYGQEDRQQNHTNTYRSEFQRDYDRLIFSSPFRRLQNKTQVFPLPGSVFVHNRLTHSLEVASVGRSLGNMVAERLVQSQDNITAAIHEIGTIVATACLAHDMGNPPFGHSGEKSLSAFFENGKGKSLKEKLSLSDQQWKDLIHFEGNANVLRLLTHQFHGRRYGGYNFTYSTLASLVKYPFPSDLKSNTKKYGYFETEKQTFEKVMHQMGIEVKPDGCYPRHPLVYLMEAADDISYLIMDLEDAHKLKIIDTSIVIESLLSFYDASEKQEIVKTFEEVTDNNESIAYLRSISINKLAYACADIFIENHDAILDGAFEKSLVDYLPEDLKKPLENLREIGYSQIYTHQKVVEIELAGYNILGDLVKDFVEAVLQPDSSYHKNLLKLIPKQFNINEGTHYEKLRGVIDYISGMTDLYALELYRNIKGIEMPSLR